MLALDSPFGLGMLQAVWGDEEALDAEDALNVLVQAGLVEAQEGGRFRSIIRVERERRDGDKVTHDTAYYISSLKADAATILEATQHHWAIENSFHWVLDVTFSEDDSRIRSGESAENIALLRAIALNLLKQDTSKSSLRQKRLRAAMDNDFLLHLLTQV